MHIIRRTYILHGYILLIAFAISTYSTQRFFAATEIAILSLNEKKVKSRANDGNKKAVKLLKIIKETTKFLSTIQFGVTLAGFFGSAFAADNFAKGLSERLVKTFNISSQNAGVINIVSVILITLILSYFTLVLGKLVPKRWAMKHKEKLEDTACGIITFLTIILKLIIWFLSVSTNALLLLLVVKPKDDNENVS